MGWGAIVSGPGRVVRLLLLCTSVLCLAYRWPICSVRFIPSWQSCEQERESG